MVTTLTRPVSRGEHNSSGNLDGLLGFRDPGKHVFETLQEKVGLAKVHAIFYKLFWHIKLFWQAVHHCRFMIDQSETTYTRNAPITYKHTYGF